MSKPVVLALGHRFESLETERNVLDGVAEVVDGNPLSGAETEELLRSVQGIMLGTRSRISPSDVALMKSCRVIVRYGIGIDNIALAEATDRGILVANVPDYCIEEVSDHTVALILAINRKIVAANKEVAKGNWGASVMRGTVRLSAQTVGLIGLGRIGRAVVRKMTALVHHIEVYDPYLDPGVISGLGARPVSLDDLLKAADYVTIHCPLTRATRHLINKGTVGKMKRTAWLINTSRGEIINEDDLAEALKSRQIGGAALDVLSSEPPSSDSPFLKLENAILTPHSAFYSDNALADLQLRAATTVKEVFEGMTPRSAVNASQIERR